MPKLTKRFIDSLGPGAPPRLIYWDSEVRGFGLSVTGAGVKTYILNYRTADGRQRRFTIGKHGSPWTCEAARDEAIKLLREVAAGADPMEAKAQRRGALTIAGLAELYLAEGPATRPSKKARSWGHDRSVIKRHIIPLLGRRPIKSVTAEDVSRLQFDIAGGKTATDERTGGRGRAIVRGGRTIAARSTACLATMLQFAVKRKLLTANPAAGVELMKGAKKERFLSRLEMQILADTLAAMEDEAAINSNMANALRLLMLTGCRKNEILRLEWAWVDFERQCLRLPDSKTGAKVIHLAEAAMAILLTLDRDTPFVFPGAGRKGPVVGLQKAWERLRVRATQLARQRAAEAGASPDRALDLTTVRIHDLRHSFASFAIADGATLFMVGKLLGHKQTRTTEIYAHLADDPLRALTERTAAGIAASIKL